MMIVGGHNGSLFHPNTPTHSNTSARSGTYKRYEGVFGKEKKLLRGRGDATASN